MVVEPFPSWDSRWKDGVRKTVRKKPYESPVLPFTERVMWKDPTLQPAKLRSSWVMVCGWGSRRQATHTSLAREWASIVARTIRRLATSERKDSSLVVGMRRTPVATRPAEAAVDHATTVTRHAVEQQWFLQSWRPTVSGQRRRRQCTSKSSSKLAYADGREGTTIIGCSEKQPSSKW